MACHAAQNPYVEDTVMAAIPSGLSEPARITNKRKRAEEMCPLLELIQATGGLPRLGVMGNHHDMRHSDNIVKDMHGQPKLLMPAPKQSIIPALTACIDSEPKSDYNLKATPTPAPAPPALSLPCVLTPLLATSTLPPTLAKLLIKLPSLTAALCAALLEPEKKPSKDLRTHAHWSAQQLRQGFNCYCCTSCAYKVLNGACQKCRHEYNVAPVVDSKLIKRLDAALFDNGSDNANSDGNAAFWDGTAWVVGTKPLHKRKAVDTKPVKPKAKRMHGSLPGIKDTIVCAQASLSKAPARCCIAKKATAPAALSADKMDETCVVYIDDIALIADSPIVHKHNVENRLHVHPNDVCVHAIDIAVCSCCKGKICAGLKTPWLLDSGASNHHTNNLDNFVNYAAWPKSEHRTLSTATSTTKIIGVGMVMIKFPTLIKGTRRFVFSMFDMFLL
jgi:hypothetical protein